MVKGAELEQALSNAKIIVDTREQDTASLRKRLAMFPSGYIRQKLNFGDYSISTELEDGTVISLADKVVVERKMSIDELATCFTKERERFTREFERAASAGARVHIIVEKGSYAKVLNHMYRSQFAPSGMLASICTFIARYNCTFQFVDADSSASVIYNILHYELRERLKNGEEWMD